MKYQVTVKVEGREDQVVEVETDRGEGYAQTMAMLEVHGLNGEMVRFETKAL